MERYVITGGPGTGKSTVIKLLSRLGYVTVPETARKIIRANLKKGGSSLPWKDWKHFQKEIFAEQLRIYSKLPKQKTIFLDRGIRDGLAYFWLNNEKPFDKLLKCQPNYKKIFILEPVGKYETDKCRKEDKATALKIHDLIEKAYSKYKIVKIPNVSPEKRVEIILKHIGGEQNE